MHSANEVAFRPELFMVGPNGSGPTSSINPIALLVENTCRATGDGTAAVGWK